MVVCKKTVMGHKNMIYIYIYNGDKTMLTNPQNWGVLNFQTNPGNDMLTLQNPSLAMVNPSFGPI